MKKFVIIIIMSLLTFALIGCDLLSTLIALKGFSDEYRDYSARYDEATHMELSAETTLSIVETNIDGLETIESVIHVKSDFEKNLTFVDRSENNVSKVSLYENKPTYVIEYLIEGNNVTPTIAASGSENVMDDVFNLNESFDVESVQNELKTGTHSYEFSLPLDNIVNLGALLAMADQLSNFDLSVLDLGNAIAELNVSFETINSVISIEATLTDYRIDFENEFYAIIALTNATTLSIPETFELPSIYEEPYIFNHQNDIRLATMVFTPGELIDIPLVADQNIWICLDLAAGTYQFESSQYGLISESQLVNFLELEVPFDSVNAIQVTIVTPGLYYYHIIPSVSFTLDLEITLMP